MSPTASTLPPLALLSGGLATRLRPLTETIPKALIEVAGAPFIAHQLRLIKSQGVDRVAICAGYLAEQIRDFVGDGSTYGLEVEYSLDGDRLLGTGGALKKALRLLGREFLVMYGDAYLPAQFAPVVEAFHRSGRVGLMTVFHNQGLYDTSNIVFTNGEIIVYDKKNRHPDMVYIDYGLGLFKASVFADWAAEVPFDLADVYKDLLARRQLAGYEVTERFYEIGSVAGIAETDRLLKQGMAQ